MTSFRYDCAMTISRSTAISYHLQSRRGICRLNELINIAWSQYTQQRENEFKMNSKLQAYIQIFVRKKNQVCKQTIQEHQCINTAYYTAETSYTLNFLKELCIKEVKLLTHMTIIFKDMTLSAPDAILEKHNNNRQKEAVVT